MLRSFKNEELLPKERQQKEKSEVAITDMEYEVEISRSQEEWSLDTNVPMELVDDRDDHNAIDQGNSSVSFWQFFDQSMIISYYSMHNLAVR